MVHVILKYTLIQQTDREDIINLKKKVDAGCEFLTTQMFLITAFIMILLKMCVKQELMCR